MTLDGTTRTERVQHFHSMAIVIHESASWSILFARPNLNANFLVFNSSNCTFEWPYQASFTFIHVVVQTADCSSHIIIMSYVYHVTMKLLGKGSIKNRNPNITSKTLQLKEKKWYKQN